LSGKILLETVYEKEGLVDRNQLEDIRGRSRKQQLQLAKDFDVEYFPTPAGGCCLTEKEFSVKLEKLMNFCDDPVKSDFELLRIGRHSWEDVESRMVHFVVGRNQEENEKIISLKEECDLIVEKDKGTGPTVLIRGFDENLKDLAIEKAREFIWKYSKNDLEDWKELEIVVK